MPPPVCFSFAGAGTPPHSTRQHSPLHRAERGCGFLLLGCCAVPPRSPAAWAAPAVGGRGCPQPPQNRTANRGPPSPAGGSLPFRARNRTKRGAQVGAGRGLERAWFVCNPAGETIVLLRSRLLLRSAAHSSGSVPNWGFHPQPPSTDQFTDDIQQRTARVIMVQRSLCSCQTVFAVYFNCVHLSGTVRGAVAFQSQRCCSAFHISPNSLTRSMPVCITSVFKHINRTRLLNQAGM